MRKGYISLLWCSFAYGTTFLCLQEKPSGFVRKGSISGGFRRRVEVQGSSGHQEQDNTHKTGKARVCIKAHGYAPKSQAAQAGQKIGTAWPCWVARLWALARSGHAAWHRRARWCWCGVKLFRDLFRSSFFILHSLGASFRTLGFLERDLKGSLGFDLAIEFISF